MEPALCRFHGLSGRSAPGLQALQTSDQRVDCILHSFRMISVFLQICEHSSQERAHRAAETPPSLDH
jgi:hypothetical protein